VVVPNVVGLLADKGIERVHAAGLCPLTRWSDGTIGVPQPVSVVIAEDSPPNTEVAERGVVKVDVAPRTKGSTY
jgi:hypothetical protein